MRKVKTKIKEANLPFEIFYGAVYVTPLGTKEVDFWYEIVNPPRVFEWNIMHHNILLNSCVDLDGVLCRDPRPEEDDDGPRYKEFIKNAEPLVIPTKTIGWIVTCRLEKYRKLTEEWLKKHGIKYKHLVMLDLPDKETRQKLRIHARYKAQVYKSTGAELFIESSKDQSIEIARLSRKPVFCFETGEMIYSEFALLFEKYNKTKKLINKVLEDPMDAIKKSPKFLKQQIESIILQLNSR